MVTKDDMMKLKENADIRFIYEIPCSLFECKNEYVVIGNIPSKTEDNLRNFSYEDWFTRMKNGSLLSYVCSINIRKHKIKELLSIYDKPDLIKFRKFILTNRLSNKEIKQECLWAIQILKEFRVNRPDVFTSNITKDQALQMFLEAIQPMYQYKIINKNE